MKRLAILGCAALIVSACGSNNNSPNGPSGPPTTVVFTAALNPANENPPITNADQSGRGTATITLHLTRDGAGAITGANADFAYSLNSFPANSTLILTHVHEGGPAVNGGAKINSGLSAANPVAMPAGTANLTFTNLGTDVTVAQQMIDNPNGYYFNVHTTLNAGGAARGQLVKQ